MPISVIQPGFDLFEAKTGFFFTKHVGTRLAITQQQWICQIFQELRGALRPRARDCSVPPVYIVNKSHLFLMDHLTTAPICILCRCTEFESKLIFGSCVCCLLREFNGSIDYSGCSILCDIRAGLSTSLSYQFTSIPYAESPRYPHDPTNFLRCKDD